MTVVSTFMIVKNGAALLTLIPAAVAALFSLFMIIEWTFTNMDYERFTKYDAYCLSTNVSNIAAFVISKRGCYGSGNIFRR